MRPALFAALLLATTARAAPVFEVSVPASAAQGALDGRLILLIARNAGKEPRLQVDPESALPNPFMFGVTVEGWKPGAAVTVGKEAFGWPARELGQVPTGEYTVQAVLNRYEVFHRGDGVTVKLPPDRGEGQNWTIKPGNFYSAPVKMKLGAGTRAKLVLDRVIPPVAPPKDTEFVKHITITSKVLSDFWGRPVTLGAHVLLPWGWAAHPEARYPLMVNHGHFPDDFGGFRTVPPDPGLKPDYSERFHLAGYNRIQQDEAYKFYQKWVSPGFPRYLVVEIQHANPYYDDSYAVDSANVGPYGTAINKELIPEIEKRFRGIGEGWARFTYGGSTGGWEALATQVFYPDMYNGAFAACPDPVDFRAYTVINLYKDRNAYALAGQAASVERPGVRNYLGEVFATTRDSNYMELVAGDRGRSTGQFDIWQAVYSPRGADGYPVPIWNKINGEIDHKVAAYWRDHWDLTHIIARDWKVLGPKLAGKIHLYVGSADTYFLNDAVYFAQDVLEGLRDPPYGGEVTYGERAEHCWNGDPTLPNAYSRLHYNTQYLPKILKRIEATAPKGADVSSWRY